MSREEQLQQCLRGLERSMPEPFWKLAEIIQLQVLEVCHPIDSQSSDFWIPYMMNDAVENYLLLKDCTMTGEFVPEQAVELPAILVKEETYVLVVRQVGGTAFTLRFRSLEEELHCYQYHAIGHFWVAGNEQWRQLVYMAGTIHDKLEYLGERVCNEQERELMPLIEFPPFRSFTPIHQSLDQDYPFTYDGIDCMERLAREAKDTVYAMVVRLYRKYPVSWIGAWLHRRLRKPKSEPLYELIRQKICKASEQYEVRTYPEPLQQYIVVTEEHPFTRTELEYEDYAFRMQFMVSKRKQGGKSGINSGFFQGNGRSGNIYEEDEIDLSRL